MRSTHVCVCVRVRVNAYLCKRVCVFVNRVRNARVRTSVYVCGRGVHVRIRLCVVRVNVCAMCERELVCLYVRGGGVRVRICVVGVNVCTMRERALMCMYVWRARANLLSGDGVVEGPAVPVLHRVAQ